MKLYAGSLVTVFMLGLGITQPIKAKQSAEITPGSYEYKIMLNNEKFTSLEKGISGFKNAIPKTIAVFADKKKPKHRIVTYLDTKQHLLKKNNFIFRKRFTLKNGIPDDLKVTLKYRGVDVNSVGQKVFLAHPSLSLEEPKFEVDIVKNPLSSSTVEKYSRSVSIGLGKFKKLSDLMVVYPVLTGLGSNGNPIDPDEKLKRVRKFVAYETVVKVEFNQFSEGSCKKASFNFWYETKEKIKPVIAEFSYVCDKKTNEANLLFQAILNLNEWVSSRPCTKTNFAYGDKSCAVK